ncbi:MAG: NUDIX hydrolase [Candidatus Hodarchaeales archaeon]|jgi:8-oxo-dGTP pyrophosphatase MutT (NUDIX family)
MLIAEELLQYKRRGNGALIRWNDFFLFVVGNEKYWENAEGQWTITYTNTGGKVEWNESIIEATKREVLEEIGCEVNLISSKRTIVCELENPKIVFHDLNDELCPILIYNSREFKMSVCIYLGRIDTTPNPRMEVPALVFLPSSQIQGGNLSSLLDAGARIIIQENREIPKNVILKPFGSADLLVKYWKEFLFLESFRQFLG